MARSARAAVLEAIASALRSNISELVNLAVTETHLSAGRLEGEIERTASQLEHFAVMLIAGTYLQASITRGNAARPTVRRMPHPIGPVRMFAASNFPFASSTLGGDTASALASGRAVVIKAPEGYPRASRRVAELARAAMDPLGTRHDDLLGQVETREVWIELVTRSEIRAVGFTGSRQGGRALFDLAVKRRDPIPCYGERGSINPGVVLPAAARDRPEAIAAGQFRTNPGLAFIPEDKALLSEISGRVLESRVVTC
jgi:NADP-dependent aldehyde dehydrogenase